MDKTTSPKEGLRQRNVGKDGQPTQTTGDETVKSEQLVNAAAEREKKKSSIIQRTIIGVLMGGFFWFLILGTNHIVISLFVVVLQVIVFKEVIGVRYREAKEKELWGFRTIHWLLFFASLFYFYGDLFFHKSRRLFDFKTMDDLHRNHLAISFLLYITAFTGFVVSLKKGLYKYQISQVAWTIMTLLVFVVQSTVMLANIFNGLIWFMLPVCLIICNDIMAYVFGMSFGKRWIKKPLTSLSPNKSWEGFIGAFFSTILFAFFLSWALSRFEWFACPKEIYTQKEIFEFGINSVSCTPHQVFNYAEYSLPSQIVHVLSLIGINKTTVTLVPIQLHAIVFALFASLIAPFGGFFASAMKRAYGIKDFGTLFPGHGGMTDRMDCQFLMGLFVYVYYAILIRPAAVDYGSIVYGISQLSVDDQLRLWQQLGKTLGKL